MADGNGGQKVRLLVADDELIIREGIRSGIEWHRLGISLIGAAANGRAALELLQREPADILLTDINMPVMDGIELCRQARRLYPNLKIIVLSGYEEFEFAKQALEVSAMKYILKPFTREELEETLVDAASDIRRHMDMESDRELAMARLQESLPLLVENVLNRLVEGRIEPAEAVFKLQQLDIVLGNGLFVVLIVEQDQQTSGEEQSMRSGSGLMTVMMKDVLREALGDRHPGVVFSGLSDHAVCILRLERQELYEDVLDLAEALKSRLMQMLQVTVSIGVGGFKQGTAGIRESYREALESLQYRFLIGRGAVIPIEQINLGGGGDYFSIPDGYADRLVLAVRYGNTQGIRGEVDALMDYMKSHAGARTVELKLAVKELVSLVLRQLVQSGNRLREHMGGDFDPYRLIDGYPTMEDMQRGLSGLLLDISSYIHDKRSNRLRIAIRQAVQFINSHYHLEELSINMLSEELKMNTSYFSRLFKQETGATFTEYLTRVRIDKAKELLRTTTKRISEITYEVGLKDPYYFSTVFKKYNGVNPTEYREG